MRARADGRNDINEFEARLLVTRALAAIERASLQESPYRFQANAVLEDGTWLGHQARSLVSIVEALRDDYRDGAMETIAVLVHADLFDDFLDMATELFAKQFIGPAAVVAGSVLEEHLRRLAAKHSVAVDDKGRPKSFDTLSVDLRKANTLTEVQRKALVSWYAQRNEAAHGHFDQLVETEVERMIDGGRDFIARHPA